MYSVTKNQDGSYTVLNAQTQSSCTLTPEQIVTVVVPTYNDRYDYLMDTDGNTYALKHNSVPSNHCAIVDNAIMYGVWDEQRPFDETIDTVENFDFSWL
jgi:hypothetical protein